MKYEKLKMDNKFVVILILLLTITPPLLSQNENKEKNHTSVKIYTNVKFTGETEEMLNIDTTQETSFISTNLNIGYITPALSINSKDGNFHEVELSKLSINKRRDHIIKQFGGAIKSQAITNIAVAIRYEYNLYLNFKVLNDKPKWRSYVGFSVKPYYSKKLYRPLIEHDSLENYPQKQTELGALLTITPRIKYSISKKYSINLNYPLTVASFEWKQEKFGPGLSSQGKIKEISGFNNLLFPDNYLVRLGVAIKL